MVMDVLARRQLLITQPNPNDSIDYLVLLNGRIKHAQKGSIDVKINYVPDRQILEATSLSVYFDTVGAETFPSAENIGILLLDDFNNELVPRWVQITVSQKFNTDGLTQLHESRFQDSQPNWSNPQLLWSFRQ